MSVNLNMDVGQIIKGLLNKKAAKDAAAKTEKRTSIALEYYKQAGIKCVLAGCSAAILVWGINYLTRSSVTKDQSEFNTLADVSAAVVKIEQDIVSSTDLLGKNRKKVEEILPMFSDIEGSKSLFKLISNIAESNNLIIKNLSQGEVTENTAPAKHLQTKILLEVEGYYPNYIRFKTELNQQKPLLRAEVEDLKLLVGSDGERKINISVNFLDYSIQKDEYEKVLKN